MSGERPGYVRGAAWVCQGSGLSGERPGVSGWGGEREIWLYFLLPLPLIPLPL